MTGEEINFFFPSAAASQGRMEKRAKPSLTYPTEEGCQRPSPVRIYSDWAKVKMRFISSPVYNKIDNIQGLHPPVCWNLVKPSLCAEQGIYKFIKMCWNLA